MICDLTPAYIFETFLKGRLLSLIHLAHLYLLTRYLSKRYLYAFYLLPNCSTSYCTALWWRLSFKRLLMLRKITNGLFRENNSREENIEPIDVVFSRRDSSDSTFYFPLTFDVPPRWVFIAFGRESSRGKANDAEAQTRSKGEKLSILSHVQWTIETGHYLSFSAGFRREIIKMPLVSQPRHRTTWGWRRERFTPDFGRYISSP